MSMYYRCRRTARSIVGWVSYVAVEQSALDDLVNVAAGRRHNLGRSFAVDGGDGVIVSRWETQADGRLGEFHVYRALRTGDFPGITGGPCPPCDDSAGQGDRTGIGVSLRRGGPDTVWP